MPTLHASIETGGGTGPLMPGQPDGVRKHVGEVPNPAGTWASAGRWLRGRSGRV